MAVTDTIAATLSRLQQQDPSAGWGYDAARRTWYTTREGRRMYQNTDMGIPESVMGEGRTLDQGMIRPTDDGGGVLHDTKKWSQERGQFYSPFSLDKLALYGTLAALTGGTLNATGVLGGTGGAAGTTATTATIPAGSGATVGGVTGAAAGTSATGAGSGGSMGMWGKLGKFLTGQGGQAALDLGRTLSGAGQASAENRLNQARILAQLYAVQANVAQQQAAAAREAQRMGINRAQVGRQMDLTAPTLTAPAFLQGRTGTLTMPTLPASSRDALVAQLNAPIPAYVPPTSPTMDPSRMEQLLGGLGLGLDVVGGIRMNQAPRRTPTPADVTSGAIPPPPSLRF